jgi:hypothetical protein
MGERGSHAQPSGDKCESDEERLDQQPPEEGSRRLWAGSWRHGRLSTGSGSACSRPRSGERFDWRPQRPRLARPPRGIDGAFRGIKRADDGSAALYLVSIMDVLEKQ